jgi:copper chaperone CopZ
MLMRVYIGIALGCGLLLQAGCGGRSEPEKSKPPDKPAAVAMQTVTLHVEGMSQRLGLFWPTWPNKVQKALEGLSGVKSVEADLENDRLHVDYDPAKLTPQELVHSVGQQGFTATIVSGGVQNSPPWIPLVSKETPIMRSFMHSLLTIITLGMISLGCNKQDAPATPTDITLSVPAMNWPSGWPDRVRKALGTLPWVEQASIQTDVDRREVRFNLKEKGAFDVVQVQNALKAQGFPKAEVKSGP